MKTITPAHLLKKGLIAALFALCVVGLIFSLNACASSAENTQEEANSSNELAKTAHLVLNTQTIEGGNLVEKDIDLHQGDSPIDMLDRAGMEYEVKESSFGSYVYAIEGIAQGDYTPMSGWLYYVNNEFAEESADKYEVHAGDTIAWTFSTGEEYA